MLRGSSLRTAFAASTATAALLGGVVAVQASAAIRTGDILVANANSPNAVVKVDPRTGQQTLLSGNATSSNDFFQDAAYDLVLDPRGTLYVLDFSVPGVVAVDSRTGQQLRVVSQGNLLQLPLGLDRDPNGTLAVADTSAAPDFDVVRIDPRGGAQTLISSNSQPGPDLFSDPYDVAVRRNRGIVVADLDATADGSGALIDVNSRTGAQSFLSSNEISGPDLFSEPGGVQLTAAGRLLTTDYSTDQVIAIGPTGQQSLVSGDASPGPQLFVNPHRTTLELSGTLLVADYSAGPSSTGSIFRVNPRSGEQALLSDNSVSDLDLLEDPTAAIVVPPKCAGQYATIYGTPKRDILAGTRFADVIVGLGGNDVIKGLAGNDRICGGKGRDRVLGGNGADRILGGPGPDRLFGGKGPDRLLGGPGRDRLFGALGRDRLFGGAGADRLFGGKGRDRLRGGPGRDRQRQ